MSAAWIRTGRCPSCGANIEFKTGTSRATVCDYCKTVVARAGQDLTALGKVAEVIPTSARVALGSHGRIDGVAFEVVGRLQYEWNAGVWDEWFIALADSRQAWLAEAQGRFYVTYKVQPRPLPARVKADQRVFIEGLGNFTVTDVKRAKIVGASGELPEPVALGETPLTADMESEKGGFATIDYGAPKGTGEAIAPVLYVGKQVEFAALSLSELAPLAEQRQARPGGDALKCPSCGAPVSLLLPEQSVRVVCPNCRNLLDCSAGTLRVLGALARVKNEPRIALGSKGTLRGRAFVVAGWMIRSCHVDGVRYPWEEFLLWEEKTQSFAWLVESGGHWQLACPLSAGSVHASDDAEYDGRRFRHYSSITGEVETVLGEFYWAVHKGEVTQIDDYIAPPQGLSRELGSGEVNWSHLVHLESAEVAAAFGPRSTASLVEEGVGEIQPWPYAAAWATMTRWTLGGLAALFALLVYFALRPAPVLLDKQFSKSSMETESLEAGTTPEGDQVKSFISEPFFLTGREALVIQLSANVDQSWAYAAGAVIHDESGASSPFGIEVSHYSGYDDGESWSEGSRSGEELVSAPGAGQNILRADLQWDPKQPAPDMHLVVKTSTFSGKQFFLALLLLLAWPVYLGFQRAAFEQQRWSDSNVHYNEPG